MTTVNLTENKRILGNDNENIPEHPNEWEEEDSCSSLSEEVEDEGVLSENLIEMRNAI